MQFKAGSIIQRPIADAVGRIYKHMGIFVSEQEVIHFNGTRKGDCNAKIKSESLDEFAAEFKVTVKACPLDDDHASAVVKEARRQYNTLENDFNRKYSFRGKNCEDFAVHCYQIKFQSASDPENMRQATAPISQRKQTIWGMLAAVPAILVPAILVVRSSLSRRGDGKS